MRQEFSQVQTIQLLISADVQMMMSINKSCYFGVWNCEAFVTFVILLFYNLIISVIFIALAAYLIISSFFCLGWELLKSVRQFEGLYIAIKYCEVLRLDLHIRFSFITSGIQRYLFFKDCKNYLIWIYFFIFFKP